AEHVVADVEVVGPAVPGDVSPRRIEVEELERIEAREDDDARGEYDVVRREDPQRPAQVEGAKPDAAVGELFEQDPADEEPREDEKNIDADPASECDPLHDAHRRILGELSVPEAAVQRGMEAEDREHRDGPHPVERGKILTRSTEQRSRETVPDTQPPPVWRT